jgi:hypothetical protein
VREFSKESNCKDLGRIIELNEWNEEMLSHMYYTYLSPFFDMTVLINNNKMFDWISHSFDPFGAVKHSGNELINVSKIS